MSGVLCRCTGYRGILAAVADVAAAHQDGLPGPLGCAERTLVGRAAAAHPRATPAEEVPDSAPAGEVRIPTGTPSARIEVRQELAAPVDEVWAVLDDFGQLARCLPGAELVEVLDGDRYRGRATVALGPVKLSFSGLAQVVERDPAGHRMRVVAEGADTGGSATQADIGLHVEPREDGGAVLHATAALHLSGRVAQFGRALAGDVSRRLFEQFGTCVEQTARTGRGAEHAPKPPSALGLLLATLSSRLRAIVGRVRRRKAG
jgi:carbon-monoxide dehydrogenase small subunit